MDIISSVCILFDVNLYSETVFGYKGLVIELFYTASQLSTYVNVRYDEKINPEEFDGLQVS